MEVGPHCDREQDPGPDQQAVTADRHTYTRHCNGDSSENDGYTTAEFNSI